MDDQPREKALGRLPEKPEKNMSEDNTIVPSDDLTRKTVDPKPQNRIDDALQREIDDALAGMSIDDMVAKPEGGKNVGAAPGLRKGTIIAIHGEDVFVDLGGRSQGVLPITQFTSAPKEGDQVQVTIEGYDSAEGLMNLSMEGAVMAAAWVTLEEGQIIEGRVTGLNKGGLELNVDGIRAFMPMSQVDLYRVDDHDLTTYLNQKLRCQVVEVDPADKKLVVSRRSVLEVERAEKREQAFATLVEGQTVKGTVKSIMPYGAFVDIGGVDGLLHVKDMSHARVNDPKEVVKEGQTLELVVLKVDREARKVGLSLKQAMPDPWLNAENKYPEGTIVSGRIVRLADFGAFMELEPGLDGLVPISELTFERRLKHPSELVKENDIVKARVMTIDLTRKRISLSIKRVGDDPWMGASARWPVDSTVTGIVKRATEFGAFVELTPGVEGLVHISELSDQRVRSVGEVVQEGQTVQAKVLEVDEERHRISLSIKAMVTSADYTGLASAEPETPKVQPKRKKPLKGGLD